MSLTGSNLYSTSCLFSVVITGQAYSKANSRRIIMARGKLMSIKGAGAQLFNNSAIQQLRKAWAGREPLTKDLIVVATLLYPSNRQDLDASLVFDCLQRAGVIKNDRQLREQHLYHALDKINPRVELALYLR